MVIPHVAKQISRSGLTNDEVWAGVQIHLLRMQQLPGSCWRPGRGLSPASYVRRFGIQRALLIIRLESRDRFWDSLTDEEGNETEVEGPPLLEAGHLAEERILSLLDTDDERTAARILMISERPIVDIASHLGCSRRKAQALAVQVRALLLPLIGDEDASWAHPEPMPGIHRPSRR